MLRSLSALLAFAMAAPAVAAPCANALAGTWSLVTIRAAEPGVEQFYARAPHEVMRFAPTGDYVYVASNRPFTAAAARSSLDQAARTAPARFTYRVSGNQLLLSRDGTPFQAFVCTIADRAEAGVRRGDLILTNLPGRPALRRVQRWLR